MTEVESLVLDHLRHIRGQVAGLHGDFEGLSLRIDRLEALVERIERHLEIAPAERPN